MSYNLINVENNEYTFENESSHKISITAENEQTAIAIINEMFSESNILIQSKLGKISQFKAFARDELEVTDWKVIRHKEQIDNNIQTSLSNGDYLLLLIERQAIRDKSNSLEQQVNNATTIEQLNDIIW